SICKDHTSHDTPHRKVGNYVNAPLGNYVNDNPINLGNSVNADSHCLKSLRNRQYATQVLMHLLRRREVALSVQQPVSAYRSQFFSSENRARVGRFGDACSQRGALGNLTVR
uniref:hypothetical protein n=1 Tax=Mycobacterium marseillense TaxID=701042 RepID=UPI0019D68E65